MKPFPIILQLVLYTTSCGLIDKYITKESDEGVVTEGDSTSGTASEKVSVVPTAKNSVAPTGDGIGVPADDVQLDAYTGDEVANYKNAVGATQLSAQAEAALQSFAAAEYYCGGGAYSQCQATLDDLWNQYPIGDDSWNLASNDLTGFNRNIGNPPVYYALRMLQQISNWYQNNSVIAEEQQQLRFGIVLVGKAHGIQAQTLEQLGNNEGIEVNLTLDPLLRQDDYQVIRESIKLLRDFVTVITDGHLLLTPYFIELPDTDLTVRTKVSNMDIRGVTHQLTHASPQNGFRAVWDSIAADTANSMDWWWTIFPSVTPTQEEFGNRAFIAGGMGAGPRLSPNFISDDRSLLKSPAALGQGEYTSLERRAYMPQWLLHELFHHISIRYQSLALEPTSHSWFDRSLWPADFVGQYEADYFIEAINKRLIPQADPPMAANLQYTIDESIGAELVDSIVGEYVRIPEENDWHRGTITEVVAGQSYTWTNNAGVSWGLSYDSTTATLQTDNQNPYLDQADRFDLTVVRDTMGFPTTTVSGFVFNQNGFVKQ